MKENLKILNHKTIFKDTSHRFGFGGIDILIPDAIKNYYNSISFSLNDLKRAESFYKAIYGDNYDETRVKCFIPSNVQAPIIFIYEYGGEEQLFVIAPMIESDLAKSNSKQKGSHNLESGSGKQ